MASAWAYGVVSVAPARRKRHDCTWVRGVSSDFSPCALLAAVVGRSMQERAHGHHMKLHRTRIVGTTREDGMMKSEASARLPMACHLPCQAAERRWWGQPHGGNLFEQRPYLCSDWLAGTTRACSSTENVSCVPRRAMATPSACTPASILPPNGHKEGCHSRTARSFLIGPGSVHAP